MTVAHVAGLPIEETLASSGPVLLVALGAVTARLRARRLRRPDPSPRADDVRHPTDVRTAPRS